MKYRLTAKLNNGFRGFWCVQQRKFGIWITIAEFSMYAEGEARAYRRARQVFLRLTSQKEGAAKGLEDTL